MKKVAILIICVLAMGVSQCEGIELEVCPDSSAADPEPENPYEGVAGTPNTCVDLAFTPCKQECAGALTCREVCCAQGVTGLADQCFVSDPYPIEDTLRCMDKIEREVCGIPCLSRCRECVDTCAEYYESCTEDLVTRDALGWGWWY